MPPSGAIQASIIRLINVNPNGSTIVNLRSITLLNLFLVVVLITDDILKSSKKKSVF